MVKKNHQIEVKCPKCGLHVGNYTMDKMDKIGSVFCYNCDQNITLETKIS